MLHVYVELDTHTKSHTIQEQLHSRHCPHITINSNEIKTTLKPQRLLTLDGTHQSKEVVHPPDTVGEQDLGRDHNRHENYSQTDT